MGLFNRFRSGAGRFISPEDQSRILEAIRQAELSTSGEVRLFVESKCRFVNPVDRASEVFFGLKMDLTRDRNAVLVYVAFLHRQFALFADEGIYQAMGKPYWDAEAAKMTRSFAEHEFVDGIVKVVTDIGEALKSHFPYDLKGDKNELPDDIVFGK